jgi:histidyl-tRNA synthetase
MAKIQAPKGTRDFYPEEMRRHRHLEDVWRKVSLRAGFEEVDGPIFESLDLYIQKSGPEIVEQLYNFKDKGDRDLAIRPEFTPTLARMVAARQAALPRPVKWFNISRVCRYERAQKGRLREFWQWNCDILGAEGVAADAECIAVAIEALREFGVKSDQVEVRLSSRRLLAAALKRLGLADEKLPGIYLALDKRGKVPDEVLREMLDGMGFSAEERRGVDQIFGANRLDELMDAHVGDVWEEGDPTREAYDEVLNLSNLLDAYGLGDFIRFDVRVVRGLAYYTGPVWEVFDKRGELRSICGGGRYDNLIATMGGQPMPACGFGAGDVTTGLLLDSLNLWPVETGRVEFYVVGLAAEAFPAVGKLRAAGRSALCDLTWAQINRQMKLAADSGARYMAIVQAGRVHLRDLKSGIERDLTVDELLKV